MFDPSHHRRPDDWKRPLVFALLTLLLGLPSWAGEFGSDLRSALSAHDASSNFADQNAALEAFRRVAQSHPEQWQGHFWAAYAETQIARLVGMGRGEGEGPVSGYLDRAQRHLTRAQALSTTASDRERSSMAALQSLIFQFRTRRDDKSDGHQAQADAAMAEAIRLDSKNPVVLIFGGTSLVAKGEEGDLDAALAAVTLLRQASEEVSHLEDRSQTTYFNAEWLPYWLPRAEASLKQVTEGP